MSGEKILQVSDSISGPTGFAVNSMGIAWGLADEYDVHVLGLQSVNQQRIKITIGGETREVTEHPNLPRGKQKWDFGTKSLPRLMETLEPDILLTVNDIQMIQHVPNVLYPTNINMKLMDMPSKKMISRDALMMELDSHIQRFKEKYPLDCRWICLAPQDGEPPMPQWKNIYSTADQVVAMAKYGKSIFKKYYNMNVPYIYHGIDTKQFSPKERTQFKDKFVIGNFNRNQPRKQPVRTLRAFAKFAKGKNDVLLHMQMDWNDQFGWPLQYFGEMYGIAGKMIRPAPVGIPREQVANIQSQWDLNANTTGGEGFGLCEEINTIIHTKGTVNKLKNIKIGDEVLGKDGEYHRILDKIGRKVKELYSITPAYTMETLVTPEHPFLVSKGGDGDSLEWVKVGDIDDGDWLFTPKPVYDNILPDEIYLSDYIASNFEVDGEYIYKKMGFSPNKKLSYDDICKKYNTTKKVVEKAISYIKNDGKYNNYRPNRKIYDIHSKQVIDLVDKLLNNDDFELPIQVRVRNKIIVDAKFLEVCGWYLAEGSTNNDTFLEFDLHRKEIHIAEKISKWIEDTFDYHNNIVEFNDRNGCRLICSSSLISEFFSTFLGSGCENKKIPWLLENGGNKLGFLFKGLFFGDGHIKKENNHISLHTTSISLATKSRDILLANNILTSFQKNKRLEGMKQSYKNVISTNYVDDFLEFMGEDKWQNKKIYRRLYKEFDDCFLLKISNIILIKDNFDVMDIQVEGTHSFVANGILAHNTTIEGSACGVPNVITDFTTSKELVIDGKPSPRGTLIPVKDLYWEKMDVAAVQRSMADEDEMARIFQMYYDNRDLVKQHGENGRVWAEKNSSMMKIQHQWKKLVKEVLSG